MNFKVFSMINCYQLDGNVQIVHQLDAKIYEMKSFKLGTTRSL